MRVWSDELIQKAKKLRENGFSYTQLQRKLNIPRSSLHYWISGIKKPAKFERQDRVRWAKEIQPLGALANKLKRLKRLEKIKDEVRERISENLYPSLFMQKVVLSMLYWAEGAKGKKSVVCFVNTDPKMNLLFITLLRNCFELDEFKLRLRIHLQNHHDEAEIKGFWSDLLGVPKNQFQKTVWKQKPNLGKRYRKNYQGICSIVYHSVYVKEELMLFAEEWADRLKGGKISVAS